MHYRLFIHVFLEIHIHHLHTYQISLAPSMKPSFQPKKTKKPTCINVSFFCFLSISHPLVSSLYMAITKHSKLTGVLPVKDRRLTRSSLAIRVLKHHHHNIELYFHFYFEGNVDHHVIYC